MEDRTCFAPEPPWSPARPPRSRSPSPFSPSPAARCGVNVRVILDRRRESLNSAASQYDAVFARLARAGVHVSYYSSYSGFYIHGKVVEADYRTDHGRSFIGSENFSETSLDRNRELGLITSNRAVLASIARTFAADFKRGKHVR